ncbi:hypothetical protein J2T08_000742 [Neorhizobium galegae]|uniref:DUF6460 domain-containing protein n=1 Tax=Neorhizobium galegae TaxID=399 RepID=UPI0027894AEC|nr:DUF6460 domain-containing protein [Neorhizobium galegae]MDQ0132841.1 hypothetical protein [Neorhizobium galegae]
MARFVIDLCKALLACLIMGAVLSFFGITMPSLLAFLHLTPDDIRLGIENAYVWSVPRIVLGAVIVLPAWLLIYIFSPPRGGE